jgi:hypothetical protein
MPSGIISLKEVLSSAPEGKVFFNDEWLRNFLMGLTDEKVVVVRCCDAD